MGTLLLVNKLNVVERTANDCVQLPQDDEGHGDGSRTKERDEAIVLDCDTLANRRHSRHRRLFFCRYMKNWSKSSKSSNYQTSQKAGADPFIRSRPYQPSDGTSTICSSCPTIRQLYCQKDVLVTIKIAYFSRHCSAFRFRFSEL